MSAEDNNFLPISQGGPHTPNKMWVDGLQQMTKSSK